MADNPIPSVLINAKIYNEGRELMGIGTVELPDFEYMTESVSGLGLGGELDMPVIGHFKSMTMTITWNTVCTQSVSLLAPKTHQLAIYGSIQNWGNDNFTAQAVKVLVKGAPKKSGVGKFEPGKKMEPGNDFEITYIKMSIGGAEVLEIDKKNLIQRINGVDHLETVRAHLGMA